ncbi:hypothetical protein FRC03_004174 [Tulasnella sp. 419]|nr:hypothetical protein FRC03_004174 [Tulasnella sp. 419]
MDIFGAVSSSIDLGLKIKAWCDQVGQNRTEKARLSADVVETLCQIQDYITQQPLEVSEGLRNDLFEFENNLRGILHRQQSSTMPAGDGIAGSSSRRARELYRANDIKDELEALRGKLRVFRQKLEMSCALRTDGRVAGVSNQVSEVQEQLHVTDRKVDAILDRLDQLVPGSNLNRRRTLKRIKEQMQPWISNMSSDGSLMDDARRLQRLSLTLSSPSSSGESATTPPPSTSRFHRRNASSLGVDDIIPSPRFRNHSPRTPRSPGSNPFRGLAVLEGSCATNFTAEGAIKEAVSLLSSLMSGQELSHVDALMDLLRLGRSLRELKIDEEANEIYDWALHICGSLSENGDAATLFDQAVFLHKLFADLAERGHSEDATRMLEESVKVRHQLVDKNQTSYLARLGGSLNAVTEKMKCSEVVVHAWAEVVEIWRWLLEKDRGFYLPFLGRAIYQLAVMKNELGQLEGAVEVMTEAVKIRRELVQKDWTSRPQLADALHNLAIYLNKLKRNKDAVDSAGSAVRMRKLCVIKGQSDRLPDVAASLEVLSMCLTTTRRQTEAMKTRQETIEVYRQLVERDRATYLPRLAPLLAECQRSLKISGNVDEALVLTAESLQVHRELLSSDRQTYLPGLASSLSNMTRLMQHLELLEDAVETEEELVAVRRELVARDSKTYLPNLVAALQTMATDLEKLERSKDAMKAEEEVVRLCRDLVEMDRKTHLPHLAVNCLAYACDQDVPRETIQGRYSAGGRSNRAFPGTHSTRWEDSGASTGEFAMSAHSLLGEAGTLSRCNEDRRGARC